MTLLKTAPYRKSQSPALTLFLVILDLKRVIHVVFMNLLKQSNRYKSRIFQYFTRSFKNSSNLTQLDTIKLNPIKILVTRPNHRLGNQILLTPLVQELEAQFPNCEIDIVVNGGISNILFCNYARVKTIFNLSKKPFKNLGKYISTCLRILNRRYDLALPGCEDSNSAKIFVKLSRSRFKIYSIKSGYKVPAKHIAKKPVFNLRSFLCSTEELNEMAVPTLNLRLSASEVTEGRLLLHKLLGNEKKTVCIFTNATKAKKLKKEWWVGLTEAIQSEFPNVNIFEMLPKENTSQVNFKYPHYLSEDLRLMAAIIDNCEVFIGADSGVMHLAASTRSAVIGLFNGHTNPEVYGPYGPDKTYVNVNEVSVAQIINQLNPLLDTPRG